MNADIRTRAFCAGDYDVVVELWRDAEGVEVAEGDDRETILRFLQRNPELSRVALRGEELVGAVLCGHDGRRGLLYHLAVRPDCRGQGVGRKLVAECLTGLRAAGIRRALILVAADNVDGRAFWLARGFEEISADVLGVDIA
jgi:putative acetyltransferase